MANVHSAQSRTLPMEAVMLEQRVAALEQKMLLSDVRMVNIELCLMLLSERIARLETEAPAKQKEARKWWLWKTDD